MIKPTIGRRVWFWPSKKQLSEGVFHVEDPMQACDAGVVFVVDDRKVHLFVTDHWGRTGFVKNVQLVQDNDAYALDDARAVWMPYQVSSAAEAKKEFNPDAGKAGAPAAPLNKGK